MDGILIIDKPKNYTSHDIVNLARKALGTRRIGHIGTLDPNATGVLVLCVNKATKLVKYFENHDKTYQATIRLGIQTDTDDITGKVIHEDPQPDVTKAKINLALGSFLGPQKQTPPNYSAVKIHGRKLYELARRDLQLPEIEPRDVEIYEIGEPLYRPDGDLLTFTVTLRVSKGTYIRSFARDLGLALGTYGTLVDLRRLSIDGFLIEDAISLETLQTGECQLKDPFEHLGLPHRVIDARLAHMVQNGRFLDPAEIPERTDVILYDEQLRPLAIYYYDEKKNQMRMSVKWC